MQSVLAWEYYLFPFLEVSVPPHYLFCTWVWTLGYWLWFTQFTQLFCILRPEFQDGMGWVTTTSSTIKVVLLYSTHLPSLGIFPHLCLGTGRREISIQTLLFLLFNTFPILTSPSYLHMILCFDFVLNIRTHELFFPLNHVFKKLNWWRGEREKCFQTPQINQINTF